MPEQTEYQYNYELLNHAYELCKMRRHEYVFPEHLLYMMVGYIDFQTAVHTMGGRVSSITYNLNNYFETLDKVPGTEDYEPDISVQLHEILRNMPYQEHPSELTNATYLLKNLMKLKDSYGAYVLTKEVGGESKVEDFLLEFQKEVAIALLDNAFGVDDTPSNVSLPSQSSENSLTVCMNDMLEGRPPLIGREAELERTIEVLCRKDKNNPLHVGEPGVGKTALVWGLVRKIVNGDVPKRLKHSQVFMLDVGTLVAQSQYRGEMEKALQTEMDLIGKTPGSIVYIDNIHTLVGAGRNNDSALDATDILKPYLDSGNIRFIGTTTYNEQKRFIERNQGLARRFQQIEIKEPEINEAIDILTQLKPLYEDFHKVHYSNEVINFAVRASSKYMRDRFLPDKALDLIDEAGARMELHPTKSRWVTKELIADVLSKTSKVGTVRLDDESQEQIATLGPRILNNIYGQDEAVNRVVEAIQMSTAGLSDEGKPLASLLFVGPTGVGKTEVARVLARELGVELLRFDMSEYTEKHTVAKLIGSPAGYVGYDDGGLLTDAIRRNPSCVLLMDEIEKAHSDIYNILLQVMDYANLTDSQGKRADFRNVVLIMTSNAGAQYANQASVGFGGGVSRGEAMQKQVKKIFKPEFINRLTSIVTFNDMDRTMAELILRKKLRELEEKLSAKRVKMELTNAALAQLLDEGFSKEYGAREMDRVIGTRLKPLLMREILFGRLKKGGKIKIDKQDLNGMKTE